MFIRSCLIDLHPNVLHVYPLLISLEKHNGTCNTPDNPSGRIYVSLNVFKNYNKNKLIKYINKTYFMWF